MKDEEMADEYVKKEGFRSGMFGELDNITSSEANKEIKQAFFAGLKAGRPQWHTPNVPTSPINKVVLGYIKDYNSKKLCLVEWNGEWWYDANTYNDRVKVIAWCEIPTFDKE